MSKHETWRTRKYWEQIGGLLIEEYLAVPGNKQQGKRMIDGVVVLDEPNAIHKGNTYDISNKDVIVIQTKKGRIGMYLLGQAYFSRHLIARLNPRSIKCVAICSKTDSIMEEIAKQHEVEIVVIN